jgi:hypothetical protein
MTYRCRRFRSRGPAVVRWDGETVVTSPWSPSLPRPRLVDQEATNGVGEVNRRRRRSREDAEVH